MIIRRSLVAFTTKSPTKIYTLYIVGIILLVKFLWKNCIIISFGIFKTFGVAEGNAIFQFFQTKQIFFRIIIDQTTTSVDAHCIHLKLCLFNAKQRSGLTSRENYSFECNYCSQLKSSFQEFSSSRRRRRF